MYLDPAGPVRATAVLDSLIHAGELPPTVAVFVMPGRRPGMTDEEATLNRSIEYDSVTPTYARFLLDDLLPFAESEAGVQFARDPARRLICGISSGGICAFTAAWHDPSAFGRVLSHVGSFVNIRGGHNYPYLIRSTPRKPIRVFLQGGEARRQRHHGQLGACQPAHGLCPRVRGLRVPVRLRRRRTQRPARRGDLRGLAAVADGVRRRSPA